MTDKQLLEMAAKAAGIELDYRRGSDAYYYDDQETDRGQWNPLENDGQAFRLMVRLELLVDINNSDIEVTNGCIGLFETCDGDQFAATRRAIVMAAAEIGKAMEEK